MSTGRSTQAAKAERGPLCARTLPAFERGNFLLRLTDYSIQQSILQYAEKRMSFAQDRAALSQISETERRTPQQAR
ncbi:hypothetical protein BQ8482_330021 [Mesorhizobium delmotii]|uniref:Uncharacterized protein n=1 Tax=Mesorhizobium delmotii TaxID=1631247 RepID=A0A2P9AP33_9HYPH|nr:hypothetical protein BQ8482_330021 [Mesorhizobium delmotii]